jgi:hypothetical protein
MACGKVPWRRSSRSAHGSAADAAKERGAARQLLTPVASGQYRKPAHYEFLARAYLDLKKYKDAAAACERAEELRLAELK